MSATKDPQEEIEKIVDGDAAEKYPAEYAAALELLDSHKDMPKYITTYLLGVERRGVSAAAACEHIENVFVKPYLAMRGLDAKPGITANIITFNAAAALLLQMGVPAASINGRRMGGEPDATVSPATTP